ncbi:hypothetical protein NAL32_19335 [Chryseobacterium sp. Ch-15]|uniref:Uncharacterized protein n=1 Tax=Chryseobacterium muglaense TaxID=2893752 RepID=A0A9Q3UPC2_9FLAO|nr:hypothetical protein [Chryseobacterium muglaense]MBD3906095.1 hypothetical protein [Chryseobacterium muglaense]MCC9032968.1 hypothetical protein [Chryseobacterium muglaense]MCM2556548.1 hypothetical protein [Chryseobacterium muglaense]
MRISTGNVSLYLAVPVLFWKREIIQRFFAKFSENSTTSTAGFSHP